MAQLVAAAGTKTVSPSTVINQRAAVATTIIKPASPLIAMAAKRNTGGDAIIFQTVTVSPDPVHFPPSGSHPISTRTLPARPASGRLMTSRLCDRGRSLTWRVLEACRRRPGSSVRDALPSVFDYLPARHRGPTPQGAESRPPMTVLRQM
ncbi:unnamed protein product [Prorocentrum cordatum]|uniref:Uncharacterized protein n=1 Tax=Prorocentrum cordatum TaxID=2364126 RepID=A0ABN9Q4V9_9DINO|nr:unnamed protein product [Polarella glacialis]